MLLERVPGAIKKRKIYIAQYLGETEDVLGNSVASYDKPYKVSATIAPISTSYERDRFGDDLDNLLQVVLPYDKWIGKIFVKDAVYLYSDSFSEEPYGTSADYYIYGINPQNKIIRYFIKKRD